MHHKTKPALLLLKKKSIFFSEGENQTQTNKAATTGKILKILFFPNEQCLVKERDHLEQLNV